MNQKSLRNSSTEEILADYQVAVLGRHFVYKAGDHGPDYVNKDKIYSNPLVLDEIAYRMAKEAKYHANNRGHYIDLVIGPAVGGAILAAKVGFHLDQLCGCFITTAFADKEGDSFVIKRGYESLVPGKNIIIVEDVVNSGASINGVAQVVENLGGNIVSAICFYNRGDCCSLDHSCVPLLSLIEKTMLKYPANKCPLCMAEVSIVTELGHGKQFLAKMAELGRKNMLD